MPTKKATTKKSTAAKTRSTSTKKAASPKGRSGSTKTKSAKKKVAAGDQEVTIDRRQGDRRQDEGPTTTPKLERRQKVQRRRQIDPTTCERDYSEQEVEFMNAMDEYKRKSGRMFPTCSEVLEVIRELGYTKLTPAEIAVIRPTETAVAGEHDAPMSDGDTQPEPQSTDDVISAFQV